MEALGNQNCPSCDSLQPLESLHFHEETITFGVKRNPHLFIYFICNQNPRREHSIVRENPHWNPKRK